MSRSTPAARALVGALALQDGATTNKAFHLAGYALHSVGDTTSRNVLRNGRRVTVTRNAHEASAWLLKLGRKLSALNLTAAVRGGKDAK